jgi:hypothetical protein
MLDKIRKHGKSGMSALIDRSKKTVRDSVDEGEVDTEQLEQAIDHAIHSANRLGQKEQEMRSNGDDKLFKAVMLTMLFSILNMTIMMWQFYFA